MANVRPFHALRYAEGTDLQRVTAPPYDVISPDEQAQLEGTHPHNIVHLTLGSARPGDDAASNKYTRAGSYLNEWVRNGILIRDPAPGMYLYRVDYDVDGSTQTSAGVISALGLEPFGGAVLPHEKTMAAPKADRLELMRATSANLEPLWFVASEATGVIKEAVLQTEQLPALGEVTDGQSVLHRVWRLPVELEEPFARAIDGQSIMIADGHHRYETALAYRDERVSSGGPGPWDFTLALIQDPVEFGPMLRPIHRGVEAAALESLLLRLGARHYEGHPTELVQEIVRTPGGPVGILSSAGSWVADPDGLETKWLASALEEQGIEVTFTHGTTEIDAAVNQGRVVVVMPPVSLDVVISAARTGQRMPPKTTLFWPKPLSGLILRDLATPD